MNVFVPTPTPESHALLGVYALLYGYMTWSLDIVATGCMRVRLWNGMICSTNGWQLCHQPTGLDISIVSEVSFFV